LFGGIWINIDNILEILGPDYAGGKWVIFFIGLGYVIDMATGVNGNVIALSKYYRMGLVFLLILVVTVIVSMFMFIPLWGISGAAAAIALAFLVNNLMRFLFLKMKYGMQPFSFKFVSVSIIFLLAISITFLLPNIKLLPDIILRSSIFSILYLVLIYLSKISEDLRNLVQFAVRYVLTKFNWFED
jgi:O-antigen/teichoic acid export membrane protein